MRPGDTVCRPTDRHRYGTIDRIHEAKDGSLWAIVHWEPINGEGLGMVEWVQPFTLELDRRTAA